MRERGEWDLRQDAVDGKGNAGILKELFAEVVAMYDGIFRIDGLQVGGDYNNNNNKSKKS